MSAADVKLAVVCTPIGNLGDLSPRANEVLANADVILAEDTRTSAPLLDRVGAKGKRISCHQHNERERIDVVVERLEAGDRVALITDAGAPAVSDPGGRLVEGVVARGFAVEVLPGPTAVTAALMGAGLDVTRFVFLGFLPKKGKARQALLEDAAESGHAVVFYEAPARITSTLADLHAVFGERRVVVGRELTKRFETFHRGTLGSERLTPPLVDKGEMVVVIEAGAGGAMTTTVPIEDRVAALAADASLTPRKRAKALSAEYGLSSKAAYAMFTEAQEKPEAAPAKSANDLVRELAAVADTLVALENQARASRGEEPLVVDSDLLSAEIPGADTLIALLGSKTAQAAPVEVNELAKALLSALSAADAYADALEMMAEVEQARRDVDNVDANDGD